MEKEKMSNTSISIAALLGFVCPACIPALAAALGSIGFGFLASAQIWVPILFIFLIGGWIGLWIGFKRHKNILPLIVSIISGIMIPIGRFIIGSQAISYLFTVMLIVAALWNYLLLRNSTKKLCVTQPNKGNKNMGTITCPKCGAKQEMEIPQITCQAFYKCDSCNEMIKPKGDDCCVFCSYGDQPCPVGRKS